MVDIIDYFPNRQWVLNHRIYRENRGFETSHIIVQTERLTRFIRAYEALNTSISLTSQSFFGGVKKAGGNLSHVFVECN